jgi:trimeric autotransporter adhesin
LAFAAGAPATIAGGVLTVTNGAASETLSLLGIGNGSTFSVTADASGGTDIAIVSAVAPPPPANTVPATLTWNPSPAGRFVPVNTNLGSAANWGGVAPTAIDTLNFNSGAITTTLTGTATALNANFSGAAPWTLSGAQLTLGGLLTVNAGATLSGSGTVTGTITDNGTIKASGGLLTLSGPVGGTGLLQIGVGATLDVNSTSAGETISFLGGTGTLVDHQAGTIGAVISGFGAGDTIDLSSLAFAAGATASIAGGVLTVKSGAATETLRLTGIGNGSSFSVTADSSGAGTAIGIVTSVVGGLLVGTAGNDTLTGTAGNDTLLGGAGNDTLIGLAGDDVLNGGTGIDTMVGGIGNDTYFVDNALDVVTENVGEGTDTVFASVSYTLATGTALVPGPEVEILRANSATGITLTGNEFSHTIIGGAGNDTLNGGAGNDTLSGGAGNDILSGGAGNDVLNGGIGADTMVGGTGNDTYIVDNALDVVTENVGEGIDTVFASVNYTLAAGTEVENLRANSAAGLTLTGNEFSHSIVGGAGNDTLIGGVGNDTLNGGAGADTMAGGAGNDTYFVDNALDVVTEAVGGGTDTVFASVNYTLAAGTEVEALRVNSATGLTLIGNEFSHLIVGGAGNDTLNGGVGNDTLNGGAGNDTLNGGAGNDTLNGGAGADTMAGGAGNDTYFVDNALDVVTENVGEGTDTVFASVNYTLAAGTEVEILRANSAAGLTLTGNEFSHTIVGGAGSDTLIGGVGNDTLNGGAGADTMAGGAGNDTYFVDNALDVVNESVGGGSDTVFASVNYALSAGTEIEFLRANSAAGLTLTGNSFSHTIAGGAGNDTLIGGTGNDTLIGGAGNDVLDGGAGNNVMAGGLGNDVFRFEAGFGHDIITDFNPVVGGDLLDISSLGITAATFASSVTIAASAANPANTLITIGASSIQLNGVAAATVSQNDFHLAL